MKREQEKQEELLNPNKSRMDDTMMGINQTFHRGKDINEALYDIHSDALKKKQIMAEEQKIIDQMKSNTIYGLKNSEQLRIEAFKKEFRTKLQEANERISGQPYTANQSKLYSQMLDFQRVAVQLKLMGFLQTQQSQEQDDQIDDLYVLMKINKDQKVAAKNLQTVLLVVSGDRDEANEC